MHNCQWRIFFALVVIWTCTGALARPVVIPGLNVPLCSVAVTGNATDEIALRQYLSHFSQSDIDIDSLTPTLDFLGRPCIRPVVRNTSVSLVNRVVELGYADWDSKSGLFDADLWMTSHIHSALFPDTAREAADPVRGSKVQSSVRLRIPWLVIFLSLVAISSLILLSSLAKLSSLRTKRISIASLNGNTVRAKIRGIAIPIGEPLSLNNTDIKAVAFYRVTRKYGHKGWQVTDAMGECVTCSLDDGTASMDIDLVNARVHFNHKVSVYNGIPGELHGRTPYVDDIQVTYQYIPVGAVVTMVGSLVSFENGFRAAKSVHVFEGDERREIRKIKVRGAITLSVLLILFVAIVALRIGR